MTAIRSDSGFIIEPDVQPILDVDEEASIASDESIGMFVQTFMVWKDTHIMFYKERFIRNSFLTSQIFENFQEQTSKFQKN